ncbi:hypothetical protein B0H16DRAFT_831701 [Mycena metata]|uniref:Uncharacterized protein n=1 Tax=Mycena metata TaxID=1033252 RepID=A0AAD7N8K6_9AGAR|nr:hypothetical protein B0H16DRAFT_831701 [Mycena metata]
MQRILIDQCAHKVGRPDAEEVSKVPTPAEAKKRRMASDTPSSGEASASPGGPPLNPGPAPPELPQAKPGWRTLTPPPPPQPRKQKRKDTPAQPSDVSLFSSAEVGDGPSSAEASEAPPSSPTVDHETTAAGTSPHAISAESSWDYENSLRFTPVGDEGELQEGLVIENDHENPPLPTNLGVSTTVMYFPSDFDGMTSPSGIQPEHTMFLQAELPPDGGAVTSVHSPQEALIWTENHYDDPLLNTMRDREVGGPMAVMLSPETQALAIFGSVLDDWVLNAGRLLADVSKFPVMIRPHAADPNRSWAKMEDGDSPDGVRQTTPAAPEPEKDTPQQDGDLANIDDDGDDLYLSWDSSTDSDPEDLDLGTGVFRLRGGARKVDHGYTPRLGPVHNLDIRLAVQSSTGLHEKVNILSKIRFTTQPKYLNKEREGYRHQMISWTELTVLPDTMAILPDNSYSSVGFHVYGQYISRCDDLPSENFTRPNQTAKTVMTATNLKTLTAKLTAGPHPTGELSLAKSHGHTQAVENQNDRITPKWIVACKERHRFEQKGEHYEGLNFSYMSTSDMYQEQHPLKVEFSMGINVGDRKKPSNTELPPTAFIIRNQTMLWVSDRSLKSKGTGIVVLTSAYIADIQTEDELYMVENQTVKLQNNSTLYVPSTDTAVADHPENHLALSIGILPDQMEPGLLKRISNFLRSRIKQEKPAPDAEIQTLPLYEFASRGWDATRHEWRMPIYPRLDHCFQQTVNGSKTARVWGLKVVGLEPDDDGKGKGKERDTGVRDPPPEVAQEGRLGSEARTMEEGITTTLRELAEPVIPQKRKFQPG